MLGDRTQRECRDIRESPDQDDRADEQDHEQRRVRREGAESRRHELLAGQGPGESQYRPRPPIAAEEDGEPARRAGAELRRVLFRSLPLLLGADENA